ncbi:unnamed protein product [Urochloa decumbens]|uniref:F-box domain-containing protein n=1 Tax=Urochloa decumbens TaxID=240449 RepID=A0ABC9FLP3_9POAL
MAPPRALPELMAELVEEILLRLPPDDPACLVRASLVCKPWCRILSAPSFHRRYRAFHRAPPLLGFLHDNHLNTSSGYMPCFVPTIKPCPFPKRAFDDCAGWSVRDCRHGRVLFCIIPINGVNLVVWDPVTGERHRLPEPPVRLCAYNVAVLCAVRGCNHLDCHGGPFFVVLVGYRNVLRSYLYSSEAGAWNASAELGGLRYYVASRKSSVLIRDDVYFAIMQKYTILKYNLGKNCLSTIHPPKEYNIRGGIALMPMEDGSLGIASVVGSKLCLWSRNADPGVDSGWVRFRVIELKHKTPIPFKHSFSISVVGFAEGLGIIFVTTDVGAFTMELKSCQVKKVGKRYEWNNVYPFISFYTPDCASSILPSLAEAH